MKPVLLALALSIGTGTAGAADCKIKAVKGFPFEGPALSDEQRSNASDAIAKLTQAMSVSTKVGSIQEGDVVLMREGDIWLLRIAGTSAENGVVAKADAYRTRPSDLLEAQQRIFWRRIQDGLNYSLGEKIDYKVLVQGVCWRKA